MPRDQDKVLKKYAARGVFRKESEQMDLHMFFSPHCVPDGLTDAEIRLCISLYPLRKMQDEIYTERVGIIQSVDRPDSLPDSLIVSRMNSVCFERGISEFIEGFLIKAFDKGRCILVCSDKGEVTMIHDFWGIKGPPAIGKKIHIGKETRTVIKVFTPEEQKKLDAMDTLTGVNSGFIQSLFQINLPKSLIKGKR